MDKLKFQFAGINWIREMEILSNPQLINQLKMNILNVSKRINDIELLIAEENRQMLVYVQLSWLGRKFFKRQIFEETEEVLSQILPSFKFRVTDDPKLFALALEKVKEALTRRPKNEVRNLDPATDSKSVPSVGSSADGTKVDSTPSNVETDSKKQS